MKTFFLINRTFAVSAIFACVASAALAQTPIVHWDFDEGINDYSISSSDDTQAAAAPDPAPSDAIWANAAGDGLSWGVGQIGGAAFLDGSADSNGDHFFGVSDIPALEFAIQATFTGWYQPAANQLEGDAVKGVITSRVVEDDQGTDRFWGFSHQTDGDRVDARISGTGVGGDTGIVVPDGNTWFHFAVVWDGDALSPVPSPTFTVYIDGAEIGSSPTTATSITAANAWAIGRDILNENQRNFRGGVDDFAIYDTALSSGQITTLINNGLGNGTTSTSAIGTVTTDILLGDVTGAIAGSDPDGVVDQFDYFAIRDNMNTTATRRADGDANGDGLVNLDDFALWRSLADADTLVAAGLATVPEPSSLVLLSLAAVFCSQRRYSKLF